MVSLYNRLQLVYRGKRVICLNILSVLLSDSRAHTQIQENPKNFISFQLSFLRILYVIVTLRIASHCNTFDAYSIVNAIVCVVHVTIAPSRVFNYLLAMYCFGFEYCQLEQ